MGAEVKRADAMRTDAMRAGTMRADAVFEGGGMKALGLVGALSVAEERGYQWVNLAGTSAGAIVASLVAAGYTAEELYRLIRSTDFSLFRDRPLWGRIPLAGPFVSLLTGNGLYRGDAMEAWLAEQLAAKGVKVFGDLEFPPSPDPLMAESRFRFRLQVIVADISRGRMVVLPRDAHRYGLDPRRLSVAQAVRWSASLPFFFQPGRLRVGGHPGHEVYFVDGGLLSNFPVWLFDVPGRPPWPTFGFRFVDPAMQGRRRTIGGPVSYAAALVSTMLEAHDARHTKEADFVRTVAIPTMGVGTTEFDLEPARAEALYRAGRQAAADFFRRWDFTAYVAKYRQGRLHGRSA